jgi:hypothetical protein
MTNPTPADPPSESPEPPPVLVLVRDLMFSGRIGATARAINAPVRLLRDAAALEGSTGRRLIVDLNQPGALEAAVAWKGATGGEVVGFVSHVDADAVGRARAGGIDRVMARSQFVNVLPELLGS